MKNLTPISVSIKFGRFKPLRRRIKKKKSLGICDDKFSDIIHMVSLNVVITKFKLRNEKIYKPYVGEVHIIAIVRVGDLLF